MRRMLVTGAAGFIGTNFVHFWAEHHPADTIVGLDALTYAGNLSNLEPLAKNERFTFIKGDIRDGDAVQEIIKHEGIDTIVHFAAESHVDRSIRGPDPFIETNVRGTHELLKAACVSVVRRLVGRGAPVPPHLDRRGLRELDAHGTSVHGRKPPTLPTRPTQPPRRRQITSFARTTTPMGCR